MASIKKYNGSSFENAAIRKYSTASEIITPPTTIYADGSNITTYTIKGNTVQNGTPTPSDPVPVVGVGELETTGEHTGEYKIPISSGGETIDIYIGDLPLLKSLDGTAVDEISNGTLTRRVDSDGSVLPTPTTTQITMPSIPTTEGANTITVDTTVQPSEFTATWTGWHDASVQEYVEGGNLSPITAFTNTTTDTRQFIRPRIQTDLNGTQQQFITEADISTTGTISYTINITKDNDILSFFHSGANRNIPIFSISGGVPQGTYTLSFSVEGYDCSVVGGMILSNIEFVDDNGGHWE